MQTRRANATNRRRATYLRRVAAARSPRDEIHALVWWWLAEINRLPPDRKTAEIDRLKAITTTLNEGGAS